MAHRWRSKMMYQKSILMVPKATIWRSYTSLHIYITEGAAKWCIKEVSSWCLKLQYGGAISYISLHVYLTDGAVIRTAYNPYWVSQSCTMVELSKFRRIKINSPIAIIQFISYVLTICLHYKWIILLPCFGIAVTAIPRFGQFYSPNPQWYI